MFMRYRGGGVAALGTSQFRKRFKDDSDDEEDTGAEDLSSRPIGPDIDDVELPEGEAESESEQEGPEDENDESENDAEDKNDEPENDADEAGSDDDGYADL
ncbi:hypothetical protein JOM56_014995 [Amanita muscaria]